jgi:hypothetical protein
MSTQVQIRRGTTAQHSTFTGASAELTYDTDLKTIRAHDGSTAGGTTLAKSSDLTTANVSESTNLYFTNNRSRLAITATGSINYNNSTGVISFTQGNTDTIVEGSTNLYFTNARSRAAISEGTGVNYNPTTGVIRIGQNVDDHSSVTFANVTVTGNLLVQGNAILFESNTLVISDPLIQVGANPVSDTVDLGFFGHYKDGSSVERHAGLFRDASDGQFKLFANLFPEPATVVATGDASYNSANLVLNYVVGRVTDISNHTTVNLTENTNLYFTNARAIAAVTNATLANLTVSGDITASGNITSPYFYSQSDINLKKDIVKVNNALELVNSLSGYNFKWKSNEADSIGFIAHYVEEVLPMLIGTAPDGSKTVLYNGIIAILLEAVKAQQVQIDEIKSKLNG